MLRLRVDRCWISLHFYYANIIIPLDIIQKDRPGRVTFEYEFLNGPKLSYTSFYIK